MKKKILPGTGLLKNELFSELCTMKANRLPLILLILTLSLVACSKKEMQEPDKNQLPDTSVLSTESGKKAVLALFRQNYLKSQMDSVFELLQTVPVPKQTELYLSKVKTEAQAARLLRSFAFKNFNQISVNSSTGSGLRTIYFPDFPPEVAGQPKPYPVGTVLICENRDPETSHTINYEVMVKTESGWDFLLYDYGFNLMTSTTYYPYPKACFTCHYGAGNQDPFYRFAQYLNQKNPITHEEIRYDHLISAEKLGEFMEVPKQDGVFGPYLKLSKSK